jgi:hypothetical protein
VLFGLPRGVYTEQSECARNDDSALGEGLRFRVEHGMTGRGFMRLYIGGKTLNINDYRYYQLLKLQG